MSGHSLPRVLALTLIMGSAFPCGVIRGAEPKDYAYMLVQGKIADPLDRRPLARATLKLTSPAGTFEATTDDNGVFAFDRLPIAIYSLVVVSREGRAVTNIQDSGLERLNRADLEIRLGKGEGKAIDLVPRGEEVEIRVSQPSARSRRIWKQLALFLGGAAVLGLAH